MKKAVGGIKIIVFVALVLVLFVGVTVKTANKTYNERVAAESFDTLDSYKMQEYCHENAEAVMDALKSGKADKLEALMVKATGVDSVIDFANWKDADFKNAVSMGSGSLTVNPDKKGRMDVSERFFVDVGSKKYMLFIETQTSRWGRTNDGVSAVGVTTFAHFDATDYAWNGEDDGESALAGKLLWKR
ncbi:MAG: hypothetical protein KBS56_05020 [Clostridiales bacterium]|nr:hypothetical protein [Candidatus Crickella equi]